jgi:putative FmdB family regulatory protein
MPFYEYQCKNCGHDLEAMQKFSDAPLKKCPHCGKSQLQRLMSAPVFRLKGGGWYETDFKGDKDNQRNLADRPEAVAPKEVAQDTAKDAAKDGAAAGANGKGKEGNGKDGNGKDAKGADGGGAKDTAPKDKAAAKPAEKAPAESAKKVAASGSGKSSLRGRTAARGKSPVKRPVKRPAPKAKRRG